MFDPSQTTHQMPFNKEAVSDFLKWRKEWHNLQRSRRDPTPPTSPKRMRAPTPRPIVGLPIPVVEGNRPAEDASSDDDDGDDNAIQQNIVQIQGPNIAARAVQRPIARVPPAFRHGPVRRPFPPLLLPRQGQQMPHHVFPAQHHQVRHPLLHVPPLLLHRQGPPMPHFAFHAPHHPIPFPIVNVPPLPLPPRGNQCCGLLCLFNITIIQSTAYRFRCPTRGNQCCVLLCLFNTTIIQSTAYRFRCPTRGNQCCVLLCLFNTTIIQSTAYRFRCPTRGNQCCVLLCLFNITIIQSTAYRFRCPTRGNQCCVLLCLFNTTIIQSTAYRFRCPIREMTREYSESEILEYVSAGPKQYALKMRRKKDGVIWHKTKIRGMTLDRRNEFKYELFKDMVLNHREGFKKVFRYPEKIGPTRDCRVLSRDVKKEYEPVQKKGIIDVDYNVLPFGYH
ncbi:hypothetical protein niasHS_009434 [Heterodera schachtii]|uniref:Uncharacterized protein n=1 Tax=Heterodera schachtii TaxID=97005 RepID=A0ABD2J065_HETSC